MKFCKHEKATNTICTPELVAHQEEEKKTEIKDSILDFEPGSKDSVWLEEE